MYMHYTYVRYYTRLINYFKPIIIKMMIYFLLVSSDLGPMLNTIHIIFLLYLNQTDNLFFLGISSYLCLMLDTIHILSLFCCSQTDNLFSMVIILFMSNATYYLYPIFIL